MESRKLPCELCGSEVAIRSTIKTGEYKGQKACPVCKATHDKKPKARTVLKRITDKTKQKRQKERENYPKFFRMSIEELKKDPRCQNCGEKINASFQPHHNIAHILPKQRYKSVATHPDNKVFLCASKDYRNACHEKFDSGASAMVEMPVFLLAVEKFQRFKDKVTENGKLFHILSEY